MNLGIKSIEVMKRLLGLKETTGANDGPFLNFLDLWANNGKPGLQNAPWCVMFRTWAIHQAASELAIVTDHIITCSSSEYYAWAKSNGRLLAAPIAGATGLVRGSGGVDGKTHHHGFGVDVVDGDFVQSIDGNWGNQVSKAQHRIADCDFVAV